MTTISTTVARPIERDARELLGPVMGFVAVTVAFAALGAYLGRDLSGATGLGLFIGAFAVTFGLNRAVANGREQLAIGLLFGLGLVSARDRPRPRRLRRRRPVRALAGGGVTAAFVAALGAYGFATSRDLSSWARPLFWALLALIAFGIVAIFLDIVNIYLLVLDLFGGRRD